MESRLERKEIKVTGRVQGVGFRHFTLKAARELGILGWVKNMPDGSVLLQAVGSPDAMDSFRKKLYSGPLFGKTERLEETSIEASITDKFESFRVAF